MSLYTSNGGLGGVRAGCQVGGGRGRAEKRLISALVLDTSVGIRFNSCRHCTDTTLLRYTHNHPCSPDKLLLETFDIGSNNELMDEMLGKNG